MKPKRTYPPRFINGIKIKRNFIRNLPYNPGLRQLARDNRKAGILAEVLFWQQVNKRKFHNIDFDRQRVIGNFIVDFYVKTLGLVVEIDGSSHNCKMEYDSIREEYLSGLGLKVFRVTDREIRNNIDGVLRALEDFIIENFRE